jgi:hypothetical protein
MVRISKSYYLPQPSIFMPRWASRITLEITGVRVERLQEITEEDAKSEGVQPTLWFQPTKNENDDITLSDKVGHISYKNGFANIWQKINGKTYPWESNPFVWVISFKRLEATGIKSVIASSYYQKPH